MRISKTAWLALGIGIFIIAFVVLYMINAGQRNEQDELNVSLSEARAALTEVVSEKEDQESQLTQVKNQLSQLELQLAQNTSLLTESKRNFPESVESINYDERLFRIADDWDLEITAILVPEPDETKVAVEVENIKVEGVTFSVTTFLVDIKGKEPESPFVTEEKFKDYIDETVDNILDFVSTIATDKNFSAASVELVDMDIPEPITDEEIEEEGITEEEIIKEAKKLTVTIKLVIYSYRGE